MVFVDGVPMKTCIAVLLAACRTVAAQSHPSMIGDDEWPRMVTIEFYKALFESIRGLALMVTTYNSPVHITADGKRAARGRQPSC